MSRTERRVWQDVDGVLLLDKPGGCTSNAALQQVRRLFAARKAGHTGSLDPMATGLLPLCLGEATKYSGAGLDADKTYRFRARLGVCTDSGDADGQVMATAPVPSLSPDEMAACLSRFVGTLQQTPPMLSALKHQGVRLYELARQGTSVERAARTVHVQRLQMLAWDGQDLDAEVTCSKGTYVRVLAEDIGAALACGAHLTALRRIAVGALHVDRACTPEALAQATPAERGALLQPVDALLADLPAHLLDAGRLQRLLRGQPVAAEVADGRMRLYDMDGRFIGLGDCRGQILRAHRLVQTAALLEPACNRG